MTIVKHTGPKVGLFLLAFLSAKIAIAAPLWVLDPNSHVGFSVEQSGAKVVGQFEDFSSTIQFHPDQLDSSRIRVVIETASVNSEDKTRDDTIRSGTFLDSTAHPQAIFTAEQFEQTGPGQFRAQGTLTLRGTSRPLNLEFTASVQDGLLTAQGSASLERLDYGVGLGEWTSTAVVSNRVDITFTITGHE